MAILKHIKRLKYIDYLIKRKATGNLEVFAGKNGLSKRAMTDVLNEMKELGFPIKYNRTRNTYYYDEEGEMVKNLFIKDGQILSKEEAAKIGRDDNLCFSEITVFELCKKI
jgi:hypothetical protein